MLCANVGLPQKFCLLASQLLSVNVVGVLLLGSTCTQFFSVDILLKLLLCALGAVGFIADGSGVLLFSTLGAVLLSVDIGNTSLRLIVDVLLKLLLKLLLLLLRFRT